MMKRPSRHDTEDDLLEMQNQFFAQKQKPSVVISKLKKENKVEKDVVQIGKTEEKYDEEIKTKSKSKKTRFQINEEDFDIARELKERDQADLPHILSKIQERDTLEFKEKKRIFHKTGFPVPPQISNGTKRNVSKSKEKSLFAQHFCSTQKKKNVIEEAEENVEMKKDIVDMQIPGCSSNQDSISKEKLPNDIKSDKEEIHTENLQKLKDMGEEKILEEQENLLANLDPKLVSFLRDKRKATVNQNTFPSSGDNPENKEVPSSTNIDDQKVTEATFDNVSDSIDPYKTFDIKKEYVNMNKVEHEKLAWMKDLPKVNLKTENVQPRFDFVGKLSPYNEDVPVNVGLHHHGKEAEAPGYTLEELFQMSRSSFHQQRVTSLQVLGRIIEKYHQQEFEGYLTDDLLKQCIDAGLIFILRWSLDDSTEQIYSAALQCLSYIFYVKAEQDMLLKLFYTANGFTLPILRTYYKKSKDDMTQEELEEDHDLTDSELVQADVILGLLQMQILPRIRYIMEVCKTSDEALTNCLSVLTRIAQHDKESAYNVYKCPRLIDVVFELLNVSNKCGTDVKLQALKLVFYLCLSGKNLASVLVDRNLDGVISTCFAMGKDDTNSEKGDLFVIACHLWSALLYYGFCNHLIRDLYPLIIQSLQQLSNYNALPDQSTASLLLVVDAAIICSKDKDRCEWSVVESFHPFTRTSLEYIQKHMFGDSKVTHPYLTTLVIRCCCSYFHIKNTKVSDINPVDLLDEVDAFWLKFLTPMMDSPLLDSILQEMSVYSDFKDLKDEVFVHDMPSNLPTYGILRIPQCSPPSLQKKSSLFLVLELIKLFKELVLINKNLMKKIGYIVMAPGVLSYCQHILESQNKNRIQKLVTTSIELLLIQDLLELFSYAMDLTKPTQFPVSVINIYLELAYTMISKFHVSQEDFVIQLFKKLIFNSKLYRTQNYVLWINETLEGCSEKEIKNMVIHSKKQLKNIGALYQKMLFVNKSAAKTTDERVSFLKSAMDKTILPNDWMFYPLVRYYNMSLNIDSSGQFINKLNDVALKDIQSCLYYLLLLEITCPQTLKDVNETIRFTRLMCLFLTEGVSSVYNEEILRNVLQALTVVYSSPSFQSYLNFEEKIPGITSFYDIYCSLIEQYLASSFGDQIFANLLTIPLQLKYDKKYRNAVWTQYCDLLRVFPIPLNQITCDIKCFMAKEQEDEEMIKIYFQCLKSGKVQPNWCPFFYLIAVYHFNQFIFRECEIENNESKVILQKFYMKECLKFQDKELRDDIIYYQNLDLTSERSIKRFIQLPPTKELRLREWNTS